MENRKKLRQIIKFLCDNWFIKKLGVIIDKNSYKRRVLNYLVSLLIRQNYVREEIKYRLQAQNTCY